MPPPTNAESVAVTVGEFVGDQVGSTVGFDGVAVGFVVGFDVGFERGVGLTVGLFVDLVVGLIVGLLVGFEVVFVVAVGLVVGLKVGLLLGFEDGAEVDIPVGSEIGLKATGWAEGTDGTDEGTVDPMVKRERFSVGEEVRGGAKGLKKSCIAPVLGRESFTTTGGVVVGTGTRLGALVSATAAGATVRVGRSPED